jgi:hypothetical protein
MSSAIAAAFASAALERGLLGIVGFCTQTCSASIQSAERCDLDVAVASTSEGTTHASASSS